jgi:hypothetical protein
MQNGRLCASGAPSTPGLYLCNNLFGSHIPEQGVSLNGVVAVTGAELIQEADGIDDPKFSDKSLISPLVDVSDRLNAYSHLRISAMMSRSGAT